MACGSRKGSIAKSMSGCQFGAGAMDPKQECRIPFTSRTMPPFTPLREHCPMDESTSGKAASTACRPNLHRLDFAVKQALLAMLAPTNPFDQKANITMASQTFQNRERVTRRRELACRRWTVPTVQPQTLARTTGRTTNSYANTKRRDGTNRSLTTGP